jgi:hypothetical protein
MMLAANERKIPQTPRSSHRVEGGGVGDVDGGGAEELGGSFGHDGAFEVAGAVLGPVAFDVEGRLPFDAATASMNLILMGNATLNPGPRNVTGSGGCWTDPDHSRLDQFSHVHRCRQQRENPC